MLYKCIARIYNSLTLHILLVQESIPCKEEENEVPNITWPSCGQFTIEFALQKLEEFIKVCAYIGYFVWKINIFVNSFFLLTLFY